MVFYHAVSLYEVVHNKMTAVFVFVSCCKILLYRNIYILNESCTDVELDLYYDLCFKRCAFILLQNHFYTNVLTAIIVNEKHLTPVRDGNE